MLTEPRLVLNMDQQTGLCSTIALSDSWKGDERNHASSAVMASAGWAPPVSMQIVYAGDLSPLRALAQPLAVHTDYRLLGRGTSGGYHPAAFRPVAKSGRRGAAWR